MADPKAGGKVDLWGAPFVEDPRESTPVVLLREQADVLTERTGGRIQGVVLKAVDKGTVWASLYAKIPSLQDYMYKILTVAHSVADNPDNPASLSVDVTFGEGDRSAEIAGMEEFRQWLETILSSEEAHAVIVNLMRYSTDRVAS